MPGGGCSALMMFASMAPSLVETFSFFERGGRLWEIGVAGCGLEDGDVECGDWESVCDM